jgi:choline monooxygenase
MQKIFVNKRIELANTLPSEFYTDIKFYNLAKEKIFLKSWQWIDSNGINKKNQIIIPINILEDLINEPIILLKNNDEIKCYSNVCTHRGNILVEKRCTLKKIVCNYHGRRFNLNGKFEFMPEFESVKNFPSVSDNLKNLPLINWHGLFFVGINPNFKLLPILKQIEKRISFLPLEKLKIYNDLSQDYCVHSHWAIYCDNFLEGFHVPYVHKDLNNVLDYNNYETEIYKNFNLQIGFSKNKKECFQFPKNHKDYEKKIAAFYYWIFPNIMLNIYPWGISLNIVCPVNKSKTKVLFRSYVFDSSKLNNGASEDLNKVELEDEKIVENVQKGINSNFYRTGRFSAKSEKGVHHFHCLISQYINHK